MFIQKNTRNTQNVLPVGEVVGGWGFIPDRLSIDSSSGSDLDSVFGLELRIEIRWRLCNLTTGRVLPAKMKGLCSSVGTN